MRRDAVQKPAIMGDDHGAAGEIVERLFQCAQCVDVEVVGRFVEEEQIGALLQDLGELDAVTFAAGQWPTFLLVGALEADPADIGACGNRALEEQLISSLRKFLARRSCSVERVARLIDVANLTVSPI